MGRPRTPVGTFGVIAFEPAAGGRVVASTRFRDRDGRLRRVSATGTNRSDAERTLKVRIADRRLPPGEGLGPDSLFPELVALWLDDLRLEQRLAPHTIDLYERNMRTLVMPAFEHYVLREITTGRVDRFLKRQVQFSYNRARQAKGVLGQALAVAVRHDALERNPVEGVARLHAPVTEVEPMNAQLVAAIRAAVASWRTGRGHSGPRPDGQLVDVVEVMLGTAARIGEILALRACDIDLSSVPATVAIRGTLVAPHGVATYRQDHPKTVASRRTIAVPTYTAAALGRRLAARPGADAERLLFATRHGTPLSTNNLRRQFRAALRVAGIEGVTPGSFRRTVATTIDHAAGADLAAALLGHSSPEITRAHYIGRQTRVDPATAEILERYGQHPSL